MHLLIDVNNNKLSQTTVNSVLITELVDKFWPLAGFPSPPALLRLSWLPSCLYL